MKQIKPNISYLLLTLIILGYSTNSIIISLTDPSNCGTNSSDPCPSLMAINGQIVYVSNVQTNTYKCDIGTTFSPFKAIDEFQGQVTISSGDYICIFDNTTPYYGDFGVLLFNNNITGTSTCPNVELEQSGIFYPIQIANGGGSDLLNVRLTFSNDSSNIDLPIFLSADVDTSTQEAKYSQNTDWVGQVGLVGLYQCPKSIDTSDTDVPFINNNSSEPIYLCTFNGFTYSVASYNVLSTCASKKTDIWDVLGQQRSTYESIGTCTIASQGNYLYKPSDGSWQYACSDNIIYGTYNIALDIESTICDTDIETNGCIEINNTIGSTTSSSVNVGSVFYYDSSSTIEGFITGILLTQDTTDITGNTSIYTLNIPLYVPNSSNDDLVRSDIHYPYVNLTTLYNDLEIGVFSSVNISEISTNTHTRYIPSGNINYIISIGS